MDGEKKRRIGRKGGEGEGRVSRKKSVWTEG